MFSGCRTLEQSASDDFCPDFGVVGKSAEELRLTFFFAKRRKNLMARMYIFLSIMQAFMGGNPEHLHSSRMQSRPWGGFRFLQRQALQQCVGLLEKFGTPRDTQHHLPWFCSSGCHPFCASSSGSHDDLCRNG